MIKLSSSKNNTTPHQWHFVYTTGSLCKPEPLYDYCYASVRQTDFLFDDFCLTEVIFEDVVCLMFLWKHVSLSPNLFSGRVTTYTEVWEQDVCYDIIVRLVTSYIKQVVNYLLFNKFLTCGEL